MPLDFDKAGRLVWHRHACPARIAESVRYTGAQRSGNTGVQREL